MSFECVLQLCEMIEFWNGLEIPYPFFVFKYLPYPSCIGLMNKSLKSLHWD